MNNPKNTWISFEQIDVVNIVLKLAKDQQTFFRFRFLTVIFFTFKSMENNPPMMLLTVDVVSFFSQNFRICDAIIPWTQEGGILH